MHILDDRRSAAAIAMTPTVGKSGKRPVTLARRPLLMVGAAFTVLGRIRSVAQDLGVFTIVSAGE